MDTKVQEEIRRAVEKGLVVIMNPRAKEKFRGKGIVTINYPKG